MRNTKARRSSARWRKRYIHWPVAGVAAWLGVRSTALLSIDKASAITGAMARLIGPRLRVSDRARSNLRFCFPGWSEAQIEATIVEVWDNFGRVAGEFAHVRHLDFTGEDPRVEVRGRKHLDDLHLYQGPAIFFSAHIGNWELLPPLAKAFGFQPHMIYRAMNAPIAERVLREAVGPNSGVFIPKGPTGARRLAHAMRKNGHIALLVDQKLNEGIEVPFFGRPALTSPAVPFFALRYRCPVLPVHVVRNNGARFSITIEPPMALPDSGNRQRDTQDLMIAINQKVEDWIRANPGQWFWLHQRWGK